MNRQQLQEKLAGQVSSDSDNSFQGTYRYFEPPLLGVASADDTLFARMKAEGLAGDLFLMPEEWLPGAATVVSYFLPFTREVRLSNYAAGKASPEWMHARFQGEAFSNKLRKLIVEELQALGEKALAPMLEDRMIIEYNKLTSNWSERHAAYVAGLGTFSLNRGLITGRGMAGRFGSVITTLKMEPTSRGYNGPFEHCPWMVEGSCGACMERCPSGAITSRGKDKQVCYEYLFVQDPMKSSGEPYGYPYSACGKCQTDVPCETRIP